MYYVYIVRCADDTLYTGYTNNLEKRLLSHNSLPNGAKYTRGRRPVSLVWSSVYPSLSEALKKEREIKCLTRVQKQALIQSSNE